MFPRTQGHSQWKGLSHGFESSGGKRRVCRNRPRGQPRLPSAHACVCPADTSWKGAPCSVHATCPSGRRDPGTESRWKNKLRTLPSTQEEASQRVLILPGLSGTRKCFPQFQELGLGLAQGPVWGQGELWGRYWLRKGTGSTRGPRCTQQRETADQGAARDHRAHS